MGKQVAGVSGEGVQDVGEVMSVCMEGLTCGMWRKTIAARRVEPSNRATRFCRIALWRGDKTPFDTPTGILLYGVEPMGYGHSEIDRKTMIYHQVHVLRCGGVGTKAMRKIIGCSYDTIKEAFAYWGWTCGNQDVWRWRELPMKPFKRREPVVRKQARELTEEEKAERKAAIAEKHRVRYQEARKDPAFMEACREKARMAYEKDKAGKLKANAEYRTSNPSYHKEWRAANQKANSAYARKFYSNPGNRAARNARYRLKRLLDGRSVESIDVGCSRQELVRHIERQFQRGMTWDNYGFDGWHIDHIRPLASYDLTDPEQVRLASHFTNLMPLWAKDNFAKGSKLVYLL